MVVRLAVLIGSLICHRLSLNIHRVTSTILEVRLAVLIVGCYWVCHGNGLETAR